MAIREILFDNSVFCAGKYKEFVDFIFNKIRIYPNDKIIIVHINLRNYYYYQRDEKLKEEIKINCIIVFEGIGMKVGFMMKGYGFLPDLNGTDLFPLLMEKISVTKTGIFLLGSKENVIEKAAKNLSIKYPSINLCGYHNGYFSADEETEIVNKINKCNPGVLFLGMGFPLQEKFALRNLDKLKVPLIWNVGGLFDTLSGKKTRAPLLVRNLRLEWLYRLIKEPRRMLHRNTVAAFWSLSDIIFKKKS